MRTTIYATKDITAHYLNNDIIFLDVFTVPANIN